MVRRKPVTPTPGPGPEHQTSIELDLQGYPDPTDVETETAFRSRERKRAFLVIEIASLMFVFPHAPTHLNRRTMSGAYICDCGYQSGLHGLFQLTQFDRFSMKLIAIIVRMNQPLLHILCFPGYLPRSRLSGNQTLDPVARIMCQLTTSSSDN